MTVRALLGLRCSTSGALMLYKWKYIQNLPLSSELLFLLVFFLSFVFLAYFIRLQKVALLERHRASVYADAKAPGM